MKSDVARGSRASRGMSWVPLGLQEMRRKTMGPTTARRLVNPNTCQTVCEVRSSRTPFFTGSSPSSRLPKCA